MIKHAKSEEDALRFCYLHRGGFWMKVILDCDPGHDDAIAIILAASRISPLELEAITTVAGNVEVEKKYNERPKGV